MSKEHVQLSPSKSATWMNCPGSVAKCVGLKNESSINADEGSIAHELAEVCLDHSCDAEEILGKELKHGSLSIIVHADMVKFIQQYLDYLRSYEKVNAPIIAETRVFYTDFVPAPNDNGTVDAIIIDFEQKICRIFDLKYGFTEVSAYQNSQMSLYALGVLNMLIDMGTDNLIEEFELHIVQPRISNFSSYKITKSELLEFGKIARDKAQLALSDKAPLVAGLKQCKWCPAFTTCEEAYSKYKGVIPKTNESLQLMSEERMKDVLDNIDYVRDYLNAVEKQVFGRLLSGENFPGYKLVESTARRKWSDEAEVKLLEQFGDKAFKKELLGITEAEKILGKEVVADLTIKPRGKPTLVKESDKRPKYQPEETSFFDDFN